MVSRSQDVTCLVPQERTSLGLGGEGGTLTLGGSTVPIRDSACHGFGLVEGDRGDNPDRPGKYFGGVLPPSQIGGGNDSDEGIIPVVTSGGRDALTVGACTEIGELEEDGDRLSAAVAGGSRDSDGGVRLWLVAASVPGVIPWAPSPLLSSALLPLHLGPCEGTSRNGKLSWQRMHVTVRPASPGPIAKAAFWPVFLYLPSSFLVSLLLPAAAS